ncbi:MAG: hypothetical protein ACI4VF_04865 [Lachnospirales bacterium]
MQIGYDVKNNVVILKDVGDNYSTLVSMGMKYNKRDKTLRKFVTSDFLNRLSKIIKLPEKLEIERQRLADIDEAVAIERAKEKSVAYIKPPIKPGLTPYNHQTKAYNMALIVFGLIKPQEVIDSANRC